MSDLNVYYVPWNFGDWLSQTSMLSPLDYALYHRLLMQCYLKGGAIKDSDIEMAIRWVCGNDLETIERSSNAHRSIVEAYFERGEDGLWHNARCDKELELMRSKKRQSQAAVRAREEKRAAKRSNIENGSGDHRTINGRSAENDQTISESIENGSNDDRAINGRSTDSEQPIILINNKELITNTINTTSKDVVTPPALDALHSPELFEQDSSETSDIVELDNDGVPVDPPKTKKRRGGEAAALLFCEAIKSFPDEWKSYIADVRPDLDPEKIFAEFSFYWTVGKGKDKRRTVKGWSSTWQTWIRRQDEPRQTYKPAPMPKRSNPILRTAEEFAAIDYHEGINPDGSF